MSDTVTAAQDFRRFSVGDVLTVQRMRLVIGPLEYEQRNNYEPSLGVVTSVFDPAKPANELG